MKIRLLLATSLITLTTVSYSQVPNGDMEDWTVYTSVASGISCDVPDGWDVPDKIAADLGISDRNCERNSDNVHGGSFAAKLTTKTLDVLGTPLDVPGTITTGVISFDFVTFTPAVAGGAAISSNYDQLGGFYQYAPSGSDTMNIAVLMFLGTDTVGAGQYRDPNTSAGYVSFVCPITYFAPVIPDKMQITITSSGGFTSLVPGSVLYVDDLEVTGGVGVEEWNGYGIKRNVYPNPASDYININNPATNDVTIEVYSLSGQRVDVKTLSPDMNSINLDSYSSGIYSFRLVDNGTVVYSNKFVVKK
ncbi:MAG: T9SS type A sorting domain-containing protein [Bacteroidetes bacterium]|jgi:hypothetical protein|nr:T9SS type A sorting domain-containing protein [Bacteroidota bacterium]MBK7568771.1 T9SS type A sorting domain-containing protein [Bacteroidota bacterium]MBP9795330.1 T9SS type A sorting domain-containing protein [Chitinophagales bacterium]